MGWREFFSHRSESDSTDKNRRQRSTPPIALRCIKELLGDVRGADQKRLGQILSDVARTSAGCELLELLLAHGIEIAFDENRGGAGYVSAQRKILLNRTTVSAWGALRFVHEAVHCRYDLTGTGANLRTDSREAFAANVLQEEIGARQAEVRIGRQLLNLAYTYDLSDWKQYASQKSVRMWLQLVHGAPYGRTPTPKVLAADASLDEDVVEGLIEAMRPYFARYVEPYRAYELRKWDISRGHQRRIDPYLMQAALNDAIAEQSNDVLSPRRPPGGLVPVKQRATKRLRQSADSWAGLDGVDRVSSNPFV